MANAAKVISRFLKMVENGWMDGLNNTQQNAHVC